MDIPTFQNFQNDSNRLRFKIAVILKPAIFSTNYTINQQDAEFII